MGGKEKMVEVHNVGGKKKLEGGDSLLMACTPQSGGVGGEILLLICTINSIADMHYGCCALARRLLCSIWHDICTIAFGIRFAVPHYWVYEKYFCGGGI